MAQYDLGKVVGEDGQQGAKGDTGNGIASISKTGSSGLVDTYTITFTNGNTTTFTVTNGSNATVTIQTSWGNPTSDSKVASEKLVKNSLDDKVSKSQTTGLLKNDGTVMSSGTGSSNWAVGNHTHSGYVSATKVTSWSSTVSDSNVPSEKLVKDSLDGKLGTSIGSNANRILTTTTGGVITTSSTLNDTKINAYHSNYVYLDNTVLTQEDFNIDVDSALKSISDSIGTAIQYIQQ